MDAAERARRYVAAYPPAVEGSGGHAALVRLLYRLGDLGVHEGDAMGLLRSWSERCSPPWSESELRSQIASAWRTRRNTVGVDVDGERARPGVIPMSARRPAWPPVYDVLKLWKCCIPVPDDPDAMAWWAHRGLPVDAAAHAAEVARVLPRGAKCPPWARIGQYAWSDTALRLLLVAWSPDHAQITLRARSLSLADSRIKEVSPLGYSTVGLCYLDAQAADVIHDGVWREAWPLDERVVTICEGGPDYIAAWAHARGRVHRWATIGVFAGSWSSAMARRIPRDSTVLLCTDDDAAGDEYARKILATLDVRRALRWRPIP